MFYIYRYTYRVSHKLLPEPKWNYVHRGFILVIVCISGLTFVELGFHL